MHGTKSRFIGVVVFALALVVPVTAFAQNRDRGRRDDNDSRWHSRRDNDDSRWDRRRHDDDDSRRDHRRDDDWRREKKCGKFVNCHDARDGRWDGRGPDRRRFSHRSWRDRDRRDDNNWERRRRRHRTHHSRFNN
jgi:hypothetical protein